VTDRVLTERKSLLILCCYVMAQIYTSIEQLIGRTPLLELTHLEEKFGLKAKLLAKLEYFNPAGSAKDRVAKAMIEAAEKSRGDGKRNSR